MKVNLILAFILYSFFSQAQSLEVGEKRRDWGWQYQSLTKSNFLGFNTDRGVGGDVALGFSMMLYNSGGFKSLDLYIDPQIRVNYYFTEKLKLNKEKIDLYGGIGISKLINAYSGSEFEIDADYPVGFRVNVGGRYFLSKSFGIKSEVSIGKFGLTQVAFGVYLSKKK